MSGKNVEKKLKNKRKLVFKWKIKEKLIVNFNKKFINNY